MRKIIMLITIMILPVLYADFVLAQDLIVFPAKGKTQEQMEKDKFECYGCAKQQTGFDPMQAQPAVQTPPPQSQAPQGQRIRGAARGAAVGAMIGGMKSRDQKR